jgi:hypothetical protein
MNQPSYITFRRHTFLSSLAMGLSAIVITLLISATVVALYVVHLASEKSDQVLAVAKGAILGLPEFTKSLPPALSDMLNDHRDPRYTHELAISARAISRPDEYGPICTEIEIVNNGQSVVSLMSLRVTLLDDNEHLLGESHEWAATPVSAEGGWKGPILPGSKRRIVCRTAFPWGTTPTTSLNAEVEVTELRVWTDATGQNAPSQPMASVPSEPGPNG